jgi:uncharacterized protein YvpB
MKKNRIVQRLILILPLLITSCEIPVPAKPNSEPVYISTSIVSDESIEYKSEVEQMPYHQIATAKEYHLDAPIISQLPEFINGCEVTSLAMLTAFVGLPYSKEDLEELLPNDVTKPLFGERKNIISWGDPQTGFVGDIRGKQIGYSIYNKPLEKLLNEVHQPGGLNLSESDFQEIEKVITQGKPIIVWTTDDFQPTEQWVSWKTPSGDTFKGTFNVHTVLLTGFDEQYVYVNNPLTGEKDQQVEKT